MDIDLEITGLDIFFQGLMKANGKIFSSISVASAYIETFIYEEEILSIQIEIINHYKIRIVLKATVFASFTSKFLGIVCEKSPIGPKSSFSNL